MQGVGQGVKPIWRLLGPIWWLSQRFHFNLAPTFRELNTEVSLSWYKLKNCVIVSTILPTEGVLATTSLYVSNFYFLC